ncbi:MAG: glyoxalase, partial [Burkholderia vietnamiensis]|nr:glyoxalase [Burkholderia vietnamiensis]
MTSSDFRQQAERANASGRPMPTPHIQRTHLSLFVRDPVRSRTWYA